MVAALIPFAVTDLINVRAFGIGVATAILLDTIIVRPVLLPAAIAVLGAQRAGGRPGLPPPPDRAPRAATPGRP